MKAFAPFLCYLVVVLSATARADIYRWDNGQLIPGTGASRPARGWCLTITSWRLLRCGTGPDRRAFRLLEPHQRESGFLDADQCQPGGGQSHQRDICIPRR